MCVCVCWFCLRGLLQLLCNLQHLVGQDRELKNCATTHICNHESSTNLRQHVFAYRCNVRQCMKGPYSRERKESTNKIPFHRRKQIGKQIVHVVRTHPPSKQKAIPSISVLVVCVMVPVTGILVMPPNIPFIFFGKVCAFEHTYG